MVTETSQDAPTALVSYTDVSVEFPVRGRKAAGRTVDALRGVSLRVDRSETVGVVGEERRSLHSEAAMIFQDPKTSLNPRLPIRSIVADEPTSALDVSVQAQIVNLLRTLKDEHDFAMVFVSHDIRVVRALSDRGVVMYDGIVVEQGPVDEVYERPRHPYTLTLLASATTVSESASTDATRLSHLLSLPRPFAGRPSTQQRSCPFANRCWKARAECLEAIPPVNGGRDGVRCVDPLSDDDRATALALTDPAGVRKGTR